ncbi:MAG: glycosyltransferase family 2 protein [Microscillaceae bacterium]|nr:glycosyltransferase family 2 protein [Microscillaceae bacterium]
MQAQKVFFIIPTYNDFSKLPAICKAIQARGFECVIVDDGSEMDNHLLMKISDVFLLRHLQNLGQGAALQTGMNFAILKEATVLVHFDADGQHSLHDAFKMIALLQEEKLDIILGSRFLLKKINTKIPPSRIYTLKAARIFNNWITGMNLSDAHNGLRVLSKKSAQMINLKQNRMAHASEIIQLIKKHKLLFAEFQTNIFYSNENHKRKGIIYILNIIWDLLYAKFLERNYSSEFILISLVIFIFACVNLDNLVLKLIEVVFFVSLLVLLLKYRRAKSKQIYKTNVIRQNAIQNACKVNFYQKRP